MRFSHLFLINFAPMREFSQHRHRSNQGQVGFFSSWLCIVLTKQVSFTQTLDATAFEWMIRYLYDSDQGIDTRSTSSFSGDKKKQFKVPRRQSNHFWILPIKQPQLPLFLWLTPRRQNCRHFLGQTPLKVVGSKFKSINILVPRSGYQQLHLILTKSSKF